MADERLKELPARHQTMTNHVEHWTDRADHYRDEVLKEISKHSTTDGSDRSLVSTAFIKMAACDFQGIVSEIRGDNPAPAFKLFRHRIDLLRLHLCRKSQRTSI